MTLVILASVVLFASSMTYGAYDLEVPVDPRDEFRFQHRKYSQQLQKAYDRAFRNDFEGAINETTKAIEIMPGEGLAYAERGRLQAILGRPEDAGRDFRQSLDLFDKAIKNYRIEPIEKQPKKGKKIVRQKADPAELARIVSTIRYQRGEAHFAFEQYQKARDDFSAACSGGNNLACTRLSDLDSIEKRGINWIPLSHNTFYDRDRIERTAKEIVRVWVRIERPESMDKTSSSPVGNQDAGRAFSASRSVTLTKLEFACSEKSYRVLDDLTEMAKQPAEARALDLEPHHPQPGSFSERLMIILCNRR